MSYRSTYTRTKDTNVVTCGCYLIIAVFNIFIGGWSVSYLLEFFAGKVIPFWGAALIGLIAGEISIPVAAVVWRSVKDNE